MADDWSSGISELVMEEAHARLAREVQVACQYGNCTQFVDSLTGRITGGIGPMGCPCDLTPGWRSARIQGMGKPHPPVLPKGRHAGRVIRARRRHALPGWVTSLHAPTPDGGEPRA